MSGVLHRVAVRLQVVSMADHRLAGVFNSAFAAGLPIVRLIVPGATAINPIVPIITPGCIAGTARTEPRS